MASPYQQRFLQQAAKLDAIGDRAGAALRRGMAREYDAWPADKRATADHMESTTGAVRCACDGNVCACEPFSRPTTTQPTRDSYVQYRHAVKSKDPSELARDEMLARNRKMAVDQPRSDAKPALAAPAKPERLGTPEQERERMVARLRKAAR